MGEGARAIDRSTPSPAPRPPCFPFPIRPQNTCFLSLIPSPLYSPALAAAAAAACAAVAVAAASAGAHPLGAFLSASADAAAAWALMAAADAAAADDEPASDGHGTDCAVTVGAASALNASAATMADVMRPMAGWRVRAGERKGGAGCW